MYEKWIETVTDNYKSKSFQKLKHLNLSESKANLSSSGKENEISKTQHHLWDHLIMEASKQGQKKFWY